MLEGEWFLEIVPLNTKVSDLHGWRRKVKLMGLYRADLALAVRGQRIDGSPEKWVAGASMYSQMRNNSLEGLN